ncbi:branched-chain amino acid ABC transporter permease [Bordetella hinzii]|uniref:Branched-chain amino acid ABC transporter permease n=3 Tax=Bordetella hinzii TaxID=103855 RepID=A0AAN1RUN3_9BORD|nr:branched-chain amino acid ABC transporter permease [Bordetella hinzii]AZW16476.1 branched-chain amino acid ABC transporter permease [Bordetella hinzii]KCB23178.1 branched-chain amino acid ABC transporter, permease protein [Bordetella hinzii OH87 BAL007II]KCB42658.1 branched-chain amino acid ABC transporter, permease protein [Bordetella hinzii 5132]KCB46110.1 branched-chain amino acid ABC transporter, permease protein [Bordetella hinzii 4161]MBZ0074241.1 branched-chain amino acid ABC transpo
MQLLQAILSGLAMGSVYALVAFGFSITYTTTKTFNFGQGAFLALAGLIGISAIVLLTQGKLIGFPAPEDVTWGSFLFALAAAMLVLALLGYVLYITAIKHFVGEAGLSWVMSTIGFGIIIQNLALLIWGPAPIAVASPLGEGVVNVLGAGVRPQEILVFGTTLVLMIVLDWALHRTKMGKAVRAVAFSKSAASLMGINANAVAVGVFAISSALAAVAGVMVAPIATASVFVGALLSLKAFSAAILGGLENPRGCIFGGFLIGLLESLIGLWYSNLREIAVFALIIVVLYFRPAGILGRVHAEKV